MILVKYYGFLKKKLPEIAEDGFWHCPEESISVEALLTQTGIDPDAVMMTILVNRMRKDRTYVLKDGDTVTVMPLSAGG